MDAIQISHLKKYYSDIKAVDDISFSVKKGDLFGLLGVNGAGKSTTIHILCTLLKATAGTVKICDYDALKEADAIRNKIGVVFQNNTLDDYLTVKENLLMRGFLYEKDLKTVQKNLYEIAEILNIQNLLSRPFRKLSGGQKRRCEIARALMNTPEILFLDEPSTGLDPQTRKLMWDCLESLRLKRRMTIFLTTHYMEEASMAQQLCIIDAGKIIASGSPSQLKNKYASDTLKIYTDKITPLNRELAALSLASYRLPNGIAIPLSTTKDALHIMPRITTPYDGIEIIQGSMDDAFIQITGKKLED